MMNLLFSIDDSFVSQFKTTLLSVRVNSKPTTLNVYVLQKNILTRTAEIELFCQELAINYVALVVGEDAIFANAPVSKRYPEAIYYRLLAYKYLPVEVEKILYLDADILCINDITTLYELPMGDFLYGAASHTNLTNLTTVFNKARLNTYDVEEYFNSGVLLMNVSAIRREVKAEDIYRFIEDNQLNLFLPDQDILNGLYGERILSLPDQLYNYDVRKNSTYELISRGQWDLDWVIEHTVLLHFCGKDKPWYDNYSGNFGSLYKHYYHRGEA